MLENGKKQRTVMTFFLHAASVRLACLRQEHNISLAELAALTGTSTEQLHAWEHGVEPVPEDLWQVLNRWLGQASSAVQTNSN